jgi:hypothetical protein
MQDLVHGDRDEDAMVAAICDVMLLGVRGRLE